MKNLRVRAYSKGSNDYNELISSKSELTPEKLYGVLKEDGQIIEGVENGEWFTKVHQNLCDGIHVIHPNIKCVLEVKQ